MQNRDCLLFEIYSARYFPHGDFFEVQLDANPSYAWRDIRGARKVLVRGRMWRIGNGCSAKVWSVPWVPGIDNLSCCSVVNVEDLEDDWVSSLIDRNTNSWDLQKIIRVFNERAVVAILKIQLGSIPRPDKWFGLGSPMGILLSRVLIGSSLMTNLSLEGKVLLLLAFLLLEKTLEVKNTP